MTYLSPGIVKCYFEFYASFMKHFNFCVHKDYLILFCGTLGNLCGEEKNVQE